MNLLGIHTFPAISESNEKKLVFTVMESQKPGNVGNNSGFMYLVKFDSEASLGILKPSGHICGSNCEIALSRRREPETTRDKKREPSWCVHPKTENCSGMLKYNIGQISPNLRRSG